MADVEERPGRQLATNLRELMKQVDIRTGTDRDTNANKERDNESVASASVRDIFARARTNLPTPASRITRPRGLSIDSDVLSTNDGDDASTVESTPIARVPPAAASLHALRQRLETASDASDLTGWDRSARSLLTTRGQASQSRLNVYDDGSNLLDEDLGQVPALTVSHVDFAPSVANTSHTSVGTPRQRPPVIPKGPSLQSASIADRLAGIPDDGLEFDDTDREDFDRNLMGDDSDDLLHRDNDLLRSSSPPPPDSPIKPPVRPISGSWENVMPEGSVMSLPNVDGRKPDRKQELNSSGGSGGSSGSRLMQAIQDEEDSYQRSMHEKSGSTAVGDETQRPSVSPDKTNRPTSRLSISEFVSPKEYQVLRERDWGRPAHSRALGLANVRTRGGTPAPGGRKRVVSGGSMAGSDAGLTSPARERTGTAKPRPHTVHLGGSFTGGGGPSLEQLGREPLDGFEDDGMSESVLEWQRRQQSIEDLQEETEVEMEITRPESPSPPSPSRSIPLPDSPPPPTRPLQRGTTPPPRPLSRNHSVPKVQLHPPQEPSVSLFGDRMVGESTTLESSRERRDSLRRDSTIREERETTIREERRESIQEEERPDSPKHLTFAQPDSPTISFMDTLPPLPEPPSDDEQSMVVQPVRPSVNTRLSRIVREPSPGSGGSGSEKTPRASTMSLRVPSPGVPTPPEPETAKEAPTTSFLGLEPTPIQSDTLEVPRPIRTRSRSNTLGTTLPRVDVNAFVQRDEIDSAATPIATRWNPPAREEKKPVEAKAPRKPSPLASQVSSPAIQSSASLPSSPVPPPLQARHSDSQLPPM
ncbi:hypothetical protein FRC11_010438, partial [Ceratobasidium sp. 423]